MRRAQPHKDVSMAQTLRKAALLHQAGRLDEAALHYQCCLSADPQQFDPLRLLGVLRAKQGKLEEAESLLRRAINSNPSAALPHNHLGMVLNLAGRHQEAIAELSTAAAMDPRDAAAHNNLGIALQAAGRIKEAIASFRLATKLKPDYAEALTNLGAALHAVKRNEEAAPVLRAALARNPRFAEAHLNLGAVLRDLDNPDEAESCFHHALAINADNALALDQLGGLYSETGRFAEGRECYLRALVIQPDNVRILFNLAQSGKAGADRPEIAALESLAGRSASLSGEQRILLHFALGKIYADLGENERSFAQYCAGNALKRNQTHYNESAELEIFERIRTVFNTELIRSKSSSGNMSDRPVFILGMMRSGSTLVEQILASHTAVIAGGERTDFNEAYKSVRQGLDLSGSYPETIASFSGKELRRIGDCYVERLEKAMKGRPAARITDKMPGNFTALGLIHLALPNAKIIHTVRDPVDTCLSCFFKLFSENQPFTYDLAELGRYYAAYKAMMAHWRKVLPADAFLDVQYEDLVNDFEHQARRIIAYCRLEWDERCLSFHETKRSVRTASQVQVRQPLNPNLARRWRPSAEKLAPLFEGLGINTEVG